MMKENGSDKEIEGDLFDILMDNGSSQLEEQFLKSKKKLLNAKRGKNELFNSLKIKLKGLDMLILILQNNKNLVKNEDLNCIKTLESLFKLAKNEKTLFAPISKKIKFITSLILKNQMNLKQDENFSEICKFVVEIMNQNLENSFLQQIIDIIKNEEKIFTKFVSCLFDKFFRGRNLNINTNDLKFLIKHTLNSCGPFFYFENLLNYIKNKTEGGARTTHQINQAFSLISYVIDLTINKINEEKNEDNNSTNTNHTVTKKSSQFKEKHLTVGNLNIQIFLKKIIEIIKENLKEEVKENEKDAEKEVEQIEGPQTPEKRKLLKQKKREQEEAKLKLKNLYTNLINLTERFFLFLVKAGVEINNSDKINKQLKTITNILEKISEKNEMTNMKKKVVELKEKAFTQVE